MSSREQEGNLMEIKICEMFHSIQGEGILEGIPSVLVRMVGCNLSCDWCDTKDILQNGKYETYTEEELLERLSEYPCKRIIITGGEPLLFDQLENLIDILRKHGYHVTIETNGTIRTDVHCDLVSISPKLSNSIPQTIKDEQELKLYNQKRINIDAIRWFMDNNNYQLKFVASNRQEDFDEIRGILNEIGEYDEERVMVMPQADSIECLEEIQAEVARLCIENKFRYANRLQLQIWRNENER